MDNIMFGLEKLKREYHVDYGGGFAFIALSEHDLEVIQEKDAKYSDPVMSRTLEALAVGHESLYVEKGLLVVDRSLQRVEAILGSICNLTRD